MTEDSRATAERFRRLAAAFADKIAAVRPERWHLPSPCEGWTARDVVRHVVDTQGLFLGLVGRELGPVPSVDDDPLAAWNAARQVVQANLDDPQLAESTFDGYFGRTTYAQAIDRFVCTDLVLHGWDLARATGLDERIDPDDVARVMEHMQFFGEAARSPQAFGPELEPPPGADELTRLLAFTGRRAWH